MSLTIRGVIPPVPTILGDDGRFDSPGMGRLIDRLLASDVDALLFVGSAGEFAQQTIEMRKEVAEFCVSRVAGRRPVIVGTASCSTKECIDMSRHAASIGADAVIVVNPFYTLLSEERIYAHYREIAEASTIPVILYNFPALTGQDLSVELVTRLALDCPNIAGIKDTVDCMSHIRRMILDVKGARPDFLVFSGFDEYILDNLLLGGDGVIPASANFAPDITCGIYKAFRDKDLAEVQRQLMRLARLHRFYLLEKPFFGLLKEAIRLTGTDIPTHVVAPAIAPDEAMKQHLRDILIDAGVSVVR